MTSLNLASNELGAEGAKIVAEAIKVTMCAPAIIMAPFRCPSDFSNNCCCLLWLDWATIQFRFFRPNSCYTGSFCVFGPVLSSPAHALMSLDMR
jgi:hypothetical protein